MTDSGWYEASGDPCIVNNNSPEELGSRYWFYAPYTCRYHFYTPSELHQCMKAKNITHIRSHGDSMSRDLYAYICTYLGVQAVDDMKLKHITNDLKKQELDYHVGNLMISESKSFYFFYPFKMPS
jgi:hypothetical protein